MSSFRSRRAMLLGAVVTAAVSAAFAGSVTTVTASPSVQVLNAVAFSMPAGDHAADVAGEVAGETPGAAAAPRRVPGGDAALLRLKRQAGGDGGLRSTVVREDASPRTVNQHNKKLIKKECKTNKSTGLAPAGIHGAAGNANLVVVTNSDIGVYKRKNCAVVSRVPLSTFFDSVGVPAGTTLFDPRVVYDRKSQRFLVTAASSNSGNDDQYQYIAVSTNEAGTAYTLYRLVLSEGADLFCKRKTRNFWDYPSVGYSKNRWLITANDFTPSDNARGAILSIRKKTTLSGGKLVAKCFNKLPANLAPPIVLDKANTAVFLSPGSGEGDEVRRIALTALKNSVNKDEIDEIDPVVIPLWTAAPGAPQPNGQRLDTLDGRFQSASIQTGGLIWNVHTVKFTNTAKVRIYRMSTSPADVFLSMVFQPTTVKPGGRDFLFNASLATRSAADNSPIFVTLSRTMPDKPNGRAAHIMMQGLNNSADSANWRYATIHTSGKEMTGCNSQPGGACPWGDYSATQIDPKGGKPGRPQAWGFNQLVGGPEPVDEFDWQTRAGQIKTLVTR